jgi:MOSC domain-containing protein YiiM
VPKQSVFEAWIGAGGVDGDRQRDPRFHGGPDRAVVVFSLDVIRALQREGHPIAIGTTGVTKFASPCDKIAGSLAGGEIARLSQKAHPGWSRVCARVIAEGLVRMGDTVELA